MELPKITKQQTHMLYLLYKFRFISTNQFQKLLNHKDPNRSQQWLKDLKEKGYIQTAFERKTYVDWSKPFVYHMTPMARHILKTNEKCNIKVLSRVYKEKTRTKSFIHKCLTVTDLYIYFLSSKDPGDEVQFFTEQELAPFDYLTKERPTAYIVVRNGNITRRFFLEWFDRYITPKALHAVFYKYFNYADSGEWEAHMEGASLPAVLFICPTQNLKKHILHFAKAIFEKEYEEKFQLFATAQNMLNSKNTNVWEKVEISD